jgi:hypothetical protein
LLSLVLELDVQFAENDKGVGVNHGRYDRASDSVHAIIIDGSYQPGHSANSKNRRYNESWKDLSTFALFKGNHKEFLSVIWTALLTFLTPERSRRKIIKKKNTNSKIMPPIM